MPWCELASEWWVTNGLPVPCSYTALNSAVSQGHIELVRFLLEKGADVNSRAIYGGTPLSFAA